jgi:sensor histidine kinase YesM
VLSIEPLVEKAVKHGIAAREPGGTVTVEVKRRNGSLAVSVADSGPGFSGGRGTREGAGVGLENVSRRLKLCYGPGADVTVESSEQGSRVSFVAPCEPASAAAMR